jgi:type I restriction enzyme S subunit
MEIVEENKVGYKKTKIGWIPEDWEIQKLGEIGNVINGLTYSPKDIHPEGTLVLRSSNVQSRQLDFKDNVFVSVDSEKFNPVKENDILICVRNGSRSLIGKNALIDKENEGVAFGAFMTIFRSPINTFLYQLFDTDFYNKEINKNLGATINSINGNNLKNFLMPIPPKKERNKITEILSDWDRTIENTKTLLEKLHLRKKGLIQQLLTGQTRLAGFTDNWKEVTLGDITKRITKKNEELNDNVITISAQRGFVRQEDYFKKRVASSTLSGYYLIENGDFAYNKSYSNGYPMGAFKRLDDFDKAVVTTLYICFSLKENVNSDFLVNYFEGGLIVRNLMKIAQEGGRAHGLLNIGLNDFFGLKLTIPSKEEQTAISNVLNSVDQEIKIHQTQLEQLKTQKKGLMQQLLTGKIRVK